jgi:DNA polymerase-3 subunit epsilon
VSEYDQFYWDSAPFLALDTETTGFGKEDRIIEIALIIRRGDEIIDSFRSLVNPEGRAINPGAMAVHGITEVDVVDAPCFHEIKDKVLNFLNRGCPWVAHQLAFDTRMLSYVIPREEWPQGIPTLCTLDYAKRQHPGLKLHSKHKLLDLAGSLQINYDPAMAHNAWNDTELLSQIVPRMMKDRPVAMHHTKLSHEWLK